MSETFEDRGKTVEGALLDIHNFLEEGQDSEAEKIIEELLIEDKENYTILNNLSIHWGSEDPNFSKLLKLMIKVDNDLRRRGIIVTEMPPTLPPPPEKDESPSSIKIKSRKPSKNS